MRTCPKCNSEMEVVILAGIEIDRCTDCYGIWLDEGELQSILLHSDSSMRQELALGAGDYDPSRSNGNCTQTLWFG